MPSRLRNLVGHVVLLILNFLVLVGVIEATQIFSETLPPLNAIVLGYMVLHTFVLLCVQLGIQVLEFIKLRMPTFIISYYFQFDDDETIPTTLLDPTKSRLAVFALLLVISGGPLLFPIFAVYGFLVAASLILKIGIDASALLQYFQIFVGWMPPIIVIIVAIAILSIVAIEFKHF